MGTTADKLAYLNTTKTAIKTAINDFNAADPIVDSSTHFRDYSVAVDANNTTTTESLSGFEAQLTEIIGEPLTGDTPKTVIVDAINERGGVVTTANTWTECADEIRYMEADWLPDRLWPDIRTIISEDVDRIENGGSYNGSYIVLSSVVDASDQTFSLNSTTSVAIKTSDGSLYTFAANGASVNHTWNPSTYVIDSANRSCRWIIVYQGTSTLDSRYASAVGDVSNITLTKTIGCLYVIFAVGLYSNNVGMYNTASLFFQNYTVQAFDFIDSYRMTTTTNVGSYFLNTCMSLVSIPWTKLPDYFSTNSFTSLLRCKNIPSIRVTSFVGGYGGIITIDGITVTNTNLGYAMGSQFSGVQYIGYLDMSACTAKTGENIFTSLTCLRHCLFKIPSFSFSLSSAINLDIESLIYICDNAPDVTSIVPAPTLTLGAILQTRVGAENLSKLITKGWTVA